MTDESVFAAALAIPGPADRAAFLDRACAGDPALRKEIDELLAAHAVSNALDRPPADLARTGAYETDPDARRASAGDRVGPYKLLERIGEGGMGEVWVADQLEPLRRRVALKLIKPGMDSRAVLARFEAERQALAVMDHPNIARVLDAGTTPDGRPFFVMELVKGTPVTDFADARRLTPRERLGLFVPVCQAIQHAHQKGIIHRDIKPSNVLVALHDETPVPKVIDFGVAKAIGQQLTEKTVYTGFGALVGTPAYMAPEQATFNQLDVDTRADVYALGVLLYELLAGTPPVEPDRLRKAALDEVLRIVRDEEPPRPSQRLSTSQAKASIAATRQTDAVRLSALMRGELDWIVMKALEKDRARRYDTPTALAKDVQRYLAGELVEARPPTLGYRLRKFARRKSTILTAVVFASMLPSLGWAVFGMLRAEDAEHVAVRARKDADWQRAEAVEERIKATVERANAEAARKDTAAQRDELRRANYVASVGLAAASLETGEVGLARDLLERTRPRPGEKDDLRGWEWHYLRRAMQGERETIPGPVTTATACAFSPDGKHLAVAQGRPWDSSGAGRLRVVERPGNRDALALQLGADYAIGIVFSPDGTRLAAVVQVQVPSTPGARRFSDFEVRVWRLPGGAPLASRRFVQEGLSMPAFSPDGRRLAVFHRGEKGGGLVVLDADDGKEVLSRRLVDDWSHGVVAYAADGRLRAAYRQGGRDSRAVRLLNPDTDPGPGRVLYDPGPAGAEPFNIDLEAGGTRVIVAGLDRVVRGWDVSGDQPRPTFTFRAEPMGTSLVGFRLSPDGRFCAMIPGAGGQLVPVWDVATGRQVFAARGHRSGVAGVAFSPDGRTLATASDDGTVKLWDAPAAEAGPRLLANLNVGGVAARADGGFSVLAHLPTPGSAVGSFVVRDVATGRELFRGPPQLTVTTTFRRATLAPDGRRVVTTNWEADDRVFVWDVATRRHPPGFPPDGIPGRAARVVTPERVLVVGPDGTRQLYDLASGRAVGPPLWTGEPDSGGFVRAAGNGREFIIQQAGTLRTVTAAGEVVATATAREQLFQPFALSPDGGTAAFNHPDGVALVDARTGEVRHRLRGHTATVWAAAFSPDGRRLFTAAADQTVRVWDVAAGQGVLALRHENGLVALALSADGHRLATQEQWNARGTVFDATPVP